jgi:hypothetical protein
VTHLTEVFAKHIPTLRYKLANGNKKIMLTTWGGLGDQVCGEPTLRYAFKLFEGFELSLLTSYPEIFAHLPFKSVFKTHTQKAKELNEEDYIVLHTYHPRHSLSEDFLLHHFTHAVDFASLCALQRQLPLSDKQIHLTKANLLTFKIPEQAIVIHPGKHWPSNTFPVDWWNQVIAETTSNYPGRVVVVGKDIDEHRGTQPVTVPQGALDLRNKLTLLELVKILQEAFVVLTNDSAPLHIAASGTAHILFFATSKHPDYLLHYRNSIQGFKMQNLATGGLWKHTKDSCPIRSQAFLADQLPPQTTIKNWLPEPSAIQNQLFKLSKLDFIF